MNKKRQKEREIGKKAKKIIIFDTTLRDGEQSPGASMSFEHKVKMALALERLGVDVIEAGFPVSSPGQFEAVRIIGEKVKKVKIAGLARCVREDVDAVYEALKNNQNRVLHLFIATSPLHREYKLKKSKKEILISIAEILEYARKYFDYIEFSPEDATRTEIDFLAEVVTTAIENGATTVNIPDTVGYAIPDEFGRLVKTLINRVPELKNSVLSVHCHNDLGLAVANSIAAIRSGATQVEVTVNGIGERAGNCALEELVMALAVRRDIMSCETGIKTELLYPTSKLLQHITGLIIPRNKPVFGDNVFSHESGIHQHGIINKRETYEIMKPESIGRTVETLVMGRHSGRHAFLNKLKQYGISLEEGQLEKAFAKFVEIADKKKEVYDEDILSIVSSILGKGADGYHLDFFYVYTGKSIIPSATVKIRKKGKEFVSASTGDGPIEALFQAIDSAIKLTPRLKEYIIQAIGRGKDAQGQVNLILEIEGKSYFGRGVSTDIVEASAVAYINAINRFYFKTNFNSKEVKNEEGNDYH